MKRTIRRDANKSGRAARTASRAIEPERARDRKRNVADAPADPHVRPGRVRPESHPERLAWAAMRRGVAAAAIETCSVLEIGCAAGANAVALAFHLPRARVVGVDSSRAAIDAASEYRDRVGVTNLELRVARPGTLGVSGRFDFIFVNDTWAHLVDSERAPLLAACARALNPRGVLAIDIAVLPGAAIDAALGGFLAAATAHNRSASTVGDLVDALIAATPSAEELHLAVLRTELASAAQSIASGRREWPVRAVGFCEFAEQARARGLEFLAEGSDGSAQSMIQMLRQALRSNGIDALAAEQAIDLYTHRRARMPLFCRAAALSAKPRARAQPPIWFAGPVRPQSQEVSLAEGVETVFVGAHASVAAAHPLLKAALVAIGRNAPAGLPIDEIGTRARALLAEVGIADVPDAKAALDGDLLALCDNGVLEGRLRESHFVARPGVAPRVQALARIEAERGYALTTAHHDTLSLDRFDRAVVLRLDGTRDVAELADDLVPVLTSGAITLVRGGEPVRDEATLREVLPRLLTATVFKLTSLGLIESPAAAIAPRRTARSKKP